MEPRLQERFLLKERENGQPGEHPVGYIVPTTITEAPEGWSLHDTSEEAFLAGRALLAPVYHKAPPADLSVAAWAAACGAALRAVEYLKAKGFSGHAFELMNRANQFAKRARGETPRDIP